MVGAVINPVRTVTSLDQRCADSEIPSSRKSADFDQGSETEEKYWIHCQSAFPRNRPSL